MKTSTLLGVVAVAAIGVLAVGHVAHSQEIDDEDLRPPDCTTTADAPGCWCNGECVPVSGGLPGQGIRGPVARPGRTDRCVGVPESL